MNLEKIREWYANPPRNNDVAGWNEIHEAMDTPGGSDHAMRQWALQRMGAELLEDAKRNKAIQAATIAQDALEGQPSAEHGQSVESRLAETAARLEDMRKDLKECVDALHESDWIPDQNLAGTIAKKWSFQ